MILFICKTKTEQFNKNISKHILEYFFPAFLPKITCRFAKTDVCINQLSERAQLFYVIFYSCFASFFTVVLRHFLQLFCVIFYSCFASFFYSSFVSFFTVVLRHFYSCFVSFLQNSLCLALPNNCNQQICMYVVQKGVLKFAQQKVIKHQGNHPTELNYPIQQHNVMMKHKINLSVNKTYGLSGMLGTHHNCRDNVIT